MKKIKYTLAGLAIVVGAVGASVTGVLAASQEQDVTINATIQSVVSAGTDFGTTTHGIDVTPGTVATNASPHAITVATNSTGGYTLQVKDKDNTTDLVHGTLTDKKIAASTNTFASPAVLTNNTWGYRVGHEASFGTDKYAGITTSNVEIRKNTSGPITGETTNITYGILVDQSLPTGTYTDVITYTITTLP